MPKDEPFEIPLITSERIYEGKIWNVVSEDFLFNGETLTREFVEHTGAVAVLTIDENEEVLFIKQYRRPVRSFLWEIPAGLLDVPGESKIDAAKRELAEEAGLIAEIWEELITFHTTPGGSSETITIFVAKNLSKSETVFETSGEEKDMEQIWVSVPEALKMVLDSDIKSPTAVVGVMAYAFKSGLVVEGKA
jgi:8-oxo-dGTP pyrophosphatase MutT (NUDIX family)